MSEACCSIFVLAKGETLKGAAGCLCACVCMCVHVCVECVYTCEDIGLGRHAQACGRVLIDMRVEVTYRPLMNARSTSPTDVGSSSDTSHPMRVTTLGSLCTMA